MSRPLLHLFGKLVYNGWAISLGGAASNFAYERRAFHVITPQCLKGLQNKLGIFQALSVHQAFQNINLKKKFIENLSLDFFFKKPFFCFIPIQISHN